ncbi:helix-turn-helix transcriptional regulator [Heyndrickxia oleronia]|uniref:helix-turn-helix domain-containing protein n=1 Tax=Heyndrickxia oleronia TaxID=38875 RepID=UPI00203F5800|nr:helix-turn-helix transcriptional regulator [Heyndrickxia oleronia]MCM3456950.1 helix-turn-helix transcriptional regulator [Heyndrickxia oleronia]
MKLTAEMLPFIRKCRGLSQSVFAEYSGIPQARLSDIETGKISITDHYTGKLFLAIGKLKFNEKELQRISELVKNQNK